MLSIFVPYRNRKHFYEDFIEHYQNWIPSVKIYMLEQDDVTLFKRGQLMNVAFRYLISHSIPVDNILFIDVDIRLKYKIPFEQLLKDHDTVIIPFNHLSLCTLNKKGNYVPLNKPSYFLDQPDGGVTLFTREIFEKCNGFSNLYIGWGREDSDFVRRNTVTRIANDMIHLEHVRAEEWKTKAFEKNMANFDFTSDFRLDGYRQTKAKCKMNRIDENVFHCKIKNIYVEKGFKYKIKLR